MRISPATDRPKSSLVSKAFDFNSSQFTPPALLAHAHQRNECYTEIHCNKTLDGLDGGYLDRNVEWGLKSAKRFDHFVPGRRAHVVSDEGFSAEIPDVYAIEFRQAMTWIDYEDQLVSHDRNRLQIGVVGQKRKDSEIQIALPEFVREASRELTRNFYLYFWVSLS